MKFKIPGVPKLPTEKQIVKDMPRISPKEVSRKYFGKPEFNPKNLD